MNDTDSYVSRKDYLELEAKFKYLFRFVELTVEKWQGVTELEATVTNLQRALYNVARSEAEKELFEKEERETMAAGVDLFGVCLLQTGRLSEKDPSMFRINKFAEDLRLGKIKYK
jgi:hypothetical protein